MYCPSVHVLQVHGKGMSLGGTPTSFRERQPADRKSRRTSVEHLCADENGLTEVLVNVGAWPALAFTLFSRHLAFCMQWRVHLCLQMCTQWRGSQLIFLSFLFLRLPAACMRNQDSLCALILGTLSGDCLVESYQPTACVWGVLELSAGY
jgi:hypothetical protein